MTCSLDRMLLTFAALWLLSSNASAHPVLKDNHDRTIVVRLQKGSAPNKLVVRVEYRLEVDEATVLLNDMRSFKDQVNPFDYANKLDYYAEFTKIYAPIYADRLIARIDKKPPADFRCDSHKARLQDDDGKSLGHLRCDFVFVAEVDISATSKVLFSFREQNYLLHKGLIALSLVNETERTIVKQSAPDEAMRKRAEAGSLIDGDRIRECSVEFDALAPPTPLPEALKEEKQSREPPSAESKQVTSPPSSTEEKQATQPEPTPPLAADSHNDGFSLLKLVMNAEYGFWLTLLLAFVLGAAHALTPGHGKTLVAAYLVGERGTIWHAMFLGLVTTLTHTGIVILIAIVLAVLPEEAQESFKHLIQNGLGLVLGLTVVCMGFWLLLQRLAGRADHVHIGGGHHHGRPDRTVGWWGLVVLGVTGGMVPCWDAIILLFYTVGTSRFWLVLPAVLSFSLGLAAVLIAIGILVVQAPRFIQSHGGDGKILRSLPMLSALAVTAVGLWLCFEWAQGIK